MRSEVTTTCIYALIDGLPPSYSQGRCRLSEEFSKLEAIHREIKSLGEKLDFIEDLVEAVIIMDLPTAKLDKKEISEIRKAVDEMKHGRRVALEELVHA